MAKDTFFYKKRSLNCRGNLLLLDEPVVMGILNVTPDSFFDGGEYHSDLTILKRAEQILNEGGSIIDIGGYSTRPGANNVFENEEINRTIPAIETIAKRFPEAIISVDTFRSKVARMAIASGASIINDISGGTMDDNMFKTVAELKVPYILMHIQGTPQTMQQNPEYENVVAQVIKYFSEKINELTRLGVNDIILDPGFGFGKTIAHNFQLLANLEYFDLFNLPVLSGLSRKSMINKVLNISSSNSLNGTTVLNTISLLKHTNILRVHDVKEAVEVVRLAKQVETYIHETG